VLLFLLHLHLIVVVVVIIIIIIATRDVVSTMGRIVRRSAARA
jgi:hypothetical protein|tara:strand:- start:102 stop:230 length:129 start_codon:yes stop_codon:yes gene_type:complete